jgi:hypothetical protein
MKQIKEFRVPNAIDLAASLKHDTEDAEKTQEFCEQFTVETDDDLEMAVQALGEIKTQHKTYKEKQDKHVSAIQEAITDIKSFFKPALDALEKAEKLIKNKVAVCTEKRLKARDKALEQVEKATPAKRVELVQQAENLTIPKISGLAVKELLSVTVVDEAAAVKFIVENHEGLPPDLLKLNKTKINNFFKVCPKDEIPGIIVKKSSSVAITPKNIK